MVCINIHHNNGNFGQNMNTTSSTIASKKLAPTKIAPLKPVACMASVLLVEEHVSRHSILKKALLDFNYIITQHISSDHNLFNEIEKSSPDIIVMGIDLPSPKTLSELAEISLLSPLPIIIFAEEDTPNVIQTSIKAGVSAYVINEIQPQRLKNIITVAQERFKEVQALRNELENTKAQLESRKLVERAKGLIMQQKNISEQAAYKILRKMAMDNGHSLAMVAKNVIDVCHLLTPK